MQEKNGQKRKQAEYRLRYERRAYDDHDWVCEYEGTAETVDLRRIIGGSEAKLRFDCDDEGADRYLNTQIDLISHGVTPDRDALAYWKRAQNTRKGDEY